MLAALGRWWCAQRWRVARRRRCARRRRRVPVHEVALVEQVEQINVTVVHEWNKRAVVHKLQADIRFELKPRHEQIELPQRAHPK